jgi:HSP20 family protein
MEVVNAEKAMQQLPIRVYQSKNQFAVAAPMVGLEPEDIQVTVDGDRVTIHGDERGPRQHRLDLIQAEWTIGSYRREIVLPGHVDGTPANATYGNGVQVLTLPKAKKTTKLTKTEFGLEPIRPTMGERVGHMGHDIQRTTPKEHCERLAQIPKRPAA